MTFLQAWEGEVWPSREGNRKGAGLSRAVKLNFLTVGRKNLGHHWMKLWKVRGVSGKGKI